MTQEREPSVMRRKAGAGRPPPEIGPLTAVKALRMAIAQAAHDVAQLVVVAGDGEDGRARLEDVADGVTDDALLMLLEGPDERFGLVVLDAQAVAALIEMQTTGRVVPRASEPRAPTRTDAVMCADFVDRLLELFGHRAAEAGLDAETALTGFRYAMALGAPRDIVMTLDDVPYRRFRVGLDLGRGAKSGALELVLPVAAPRAGAGQGHDGAGFTRALRAQVMEGEAVLRATLLRWTMALARITTLRPGDVLEIPREALGAVALEDLTGALVAEGRLGQTSGHRAVRLAPQADRDAPASRRDAPAVAPPHAGELPAAFGADPLPAERPGDGQQAAPDHGADSGFANLDMPGLDTMPDLGLAEETDPPGG